jgi:hypothetical protein
MFPSTLHSTLASAWLGFTIDLSAELRSVRITHPVKEVQ